MRYRIGIENNQEGRSLAWVLDCPGCFAYGKDETEALMLSARLVQTHARVNVVLPTWVGLERVVGVEGAPNWSPIQQPRIQDHATVVVQ